MCFWTKLKLQNYYPKPKYLTAVSIGPVGRGGAGRN